MPLKIDCNPFEDWLKINGKSVQLDVIRIDFIAVKLLISHPFEDDNKNGWNCKLWTIFSENTPPGSMLDVLYWVI